MHCHEQGSSRAVGAGAHSLGGRRAAMDAGGAPTSRLRGGDDGNGERGRRSGRGLAGSGQRWGWRHASSSEAARPPWRSVVPGERELGGKRRRSRGEKRRRGRVEVTWPGPTVARLAVDGRIQAASARAGARARRLRALELGGGLRSGDVASRGSTDPHPTDHSAAARFGVGVWLAPSGGRVRGKAWNWREDV